MVFIISFSTALLLLYTLMLTAFWRGLSRVRSQGVAKPTSQLPVSILVPFRNEEENLENLLTDLDGQIYPREKLQVVLINDSSDDGGVQLAKEFNENSDLNIKLIDSEGRGKKEALLAGFAEASGELIFQTDADCRLGPNWLNSMSAAFDSGVGMVLGPVNMIAGQGFWSRFAALEYMSLQASGGAMVLLNKPIMGSAANMAFRRELLNEEHLKIGERDSGDDVFLIQAMKEQGMRVHYNLDESSVVHTRGVDSFKEMVTQRARWGAKTPSYDSWLAKAIALLVAAYAFWSLFLFFKGLFSPPVFQLFVFVMGAKAALDYSFLNRYARLSDQAGLMKTFASSALIYPFYIVSTLVYILLFPQKWKGRAIR